MKKLFAIVLCIAMMLSLVACGGAKAPATPTEEDLAAIGYYERAINNLNEYAQTGRLAFTYADYGMESTVEYVNGQKALAEYYALLTNLAAVDRWVGTEHITNTEINWDRQAVLDAFVVVENVLVDGTYTEKRSDSEPTSIPLANLIQYDASGKAVSFSPEIYRKEIWDVPYNPAIYTRLTTSFWEIGYGEDGRIETLSAGTKDGVTGQKTIHTTRTFTYDAEGKRIGENLKNKDWDIAYTYTYNEAGRLTQLSWLEDPQKNLTIDYTYDEAGRLLRAVEKTPQRDSDGNFTILNETTSEYTYGEGEQPTGKTVQIVHMEEGVSSLKESQYPDWAIGWERTNTYSYTYDAAGNLQTKTLTYGDTHSYLGDNAGEVSPYSIETETYTYVFGSYYIYAPVN